MNRTPIYSEVPLNDLSRSTAAVREKVAAAVLRVVESGWYLQGPERDAFEREFAAFVGVAHCVGVANGTDAIQLALLGVGCAPGDEVLMAANAGGYGLTAARSARLVPRYADVHPETLGLSRDGVAAALTPKTRAVVVTDLYGLMADVEDIASLCRERSVALVEDCAQAVGAFRGGRRAGSFGDAAAFSFYPTKNLGALGDAGAVIAGDQTVADRVRSLGQYGWSTKYRIALPGGGNSRIDEIQAAVLRVRLPLLDGLNQRRREIVAEYRSALSPAVGRFLGGDGGDSVAHLAVMLVSHRASVRERLAEAGIATEIHYPVPDHRQPIWAGALDSISLPTTEATVSQALTVPCFPELTDDEVERVCEGLRAL